MLLWTAVASAIHTALPPRHVAPRTGQPLRCQEGEIDLASASAEIPPSELAKAWRREEKGGELAEALKGCPLYMVGCGSRRTSLAKILSRRLPRYREFDVPTLIVSTYNAIAGGDDPCTSTGQLCEREPIDDVGQLNRLVLDQVQSYTRTVVSAWEGAVTAADYRMMEQGIVLHIVEEPSAELSAVSSETIEQWQLGYDEADVAFTLDADVPTDDAAFQLMQDVLQFIKDNPGKSAEWKAKADAAQRPEKADA